MTFRMKYVPYPNGFGGSWEYYTEEESEEFDALEEKLGDLRKNLVPGAKVKISKKFEGKVVRLDANILYLMVTKPISKTFKNSFDPDFPEIVKFDLVEIFESLKIL